MVSDAIIAQAMSTQAAMGFLIMIIAIGIIFWFFDNLFSMINPSPKSYKARKLMVDLYVIGTIRKLATKDQIDLESEMKQIKIIEKWEKASRRSLDEVIEMNLSEQVNAENEKKLDELNKKK